jgi:hypothetical protein
MGFFVQANLVPTLGDQLWDTSYLLSENSIPGRIFHTLVSYIDRPSGIQLLAYIVTLVAIGIPMRALSRNGRAVRVIAAGMILATFLCSSRPAWSELHVRMPTVEYRELEFEHNGLFTFDKKGSDLNGQRSVMVSCPGGKWSLKGSWPAGPEWNGLGRPQQLRTGLS